MLQKAHALVQISPSIIKVACFFCQHSAILGHAASSQTVTIFLSFIILFVDLKNLDVGAFTLIQGGFFGIGFETLFIFSGCLMSLIFIKSPYRYFSSKFQMDLQLYH